MESEEGTRNPNRKTQRTESRNVWDSSEDPKGGSSWPSVQNSVINVIWFLVP